MRSFVDEEMAAEWLAKHAKFYTTWFADCTTENTYGYLSLTDWVEDNIEITSTRASTIGQDWQDKYDKLNQERAHKASIERRRTCKNTP